MKNNDTKINMVRRIKSYRIFFVLFLLVSMLSYFPLDPLWAAEAKHGGILTFGSENDFRGFDPLKINALSICGAIASSTIHERLFDTDSKGNLIPVLGLSVTPSKDGKIGRAHV